MFTMADGSKLIWADSCDVKEQSTTCWPSPLAVSWPVWIEPFSLLYVLCDYGSLDFLFMQPGSLIISNMLCMNGWIVYLCSLVFTYVTFDIPQIVHYLDV